MTNKVPKIPDGSVTVMQNKYIFVNDYVFSYTVKLTWQ